MDWSTGGNSYLSGLGAVHDNGKEDRRFKPLISKIGTTQAQTHWSGWLNNWDRQFAYSCPANMVVVGLKSYHHNGEPSPYPHPIPASPIHALTSP